MSDKLQFVAECPERLLARNDKLKFVAHHEGHARHSYFALEVL